MQAMPRCVLIVIALLALAAPAAQAAELPVTNGRDAAAWTDTGWTDRNSVLHISYDNGTRRTFPAPGPGCALGGVNSTAVGLLCLADTDQPYTLDLVDLQSGQMTHPANEAEIERHTGPTAGFAGFSLDALGDHVRASAGATSTPMASTGTASTRAAARSTSAARRSARSPTSTRRPASRPSARPRRRGRRRCCSTAHRGS
jgi:hypothetical protein